MISKLMCLSPLLVDNPDYQSPIRSPTYHLLHDTVHKKLAVPCGRCSTCIALKQNYMVQRVQMESLNHDLFYGTLTYNNESLPVVSYHDITFAYFDKSDWQNMIKMIRKDYSDLNLKYLLINEYGGKKHRPHAHFILSLPKEGKTLAEKQSRAQKLFNIFLTYWRRNYGSTRKPRWFPLCTYVRKRIHGKDYYNYDLHYLDPNSSKEGLDGVSFYVTKYILKYDKFVDRFKSKLFFNLKDYEFVDAWKLFKPRILMSKGFGSPDDSDVVSHILKGINYALSLPDAFYPFYISRQNGSTFPLSPYYSKKFLTVDALIAFRSRLPDTYLTDSDIQQFDNKQFQFGKVKSLLDSVSLEVDYDLMDDTNLNSLYNDEFYRFDSENQNTAFDWQDSEFDCDSPDVDRDDLFCS